MRSLKLLSILFVLPALCSAGDAPHALPKPNSAEISRAWIRANENGEFPDIDFFSDQRPGLANPQSQKLQAEAKQRQRQIFLSAADECVDRMQRGLPIELHIVVGFGLPGIVPAFDPDSGVPREWIGCVVDEQRDVADSAKRWVLSWYKSRGILAINSQLRRMTWSVPKELAWSSLDSPVEGMHAEVVAIKRPLIEPPTTNEGDWYTYNFLKVTRPDSSTFTLEEDLHSENPQIVWAFHKATQSLWVRFEEPGEVKPITVALQLDPVTGRILTVHPMAPDREVGERWLSMIRPSVPSTPPTAPGNNSPISSTTDKHP